MKLLYAIIIAAAATDLAAAQTIPLPPPRPAAPGMAKPLSGPGDLHLTACRLRLTTVAVAVSLPPIDAPGGCGGPDIVRLEVILLKDRNRVALTPPATLRCEMAEALANWVRDDIAGPSLDLGARLASIDNYASYHCRGRNNIAGAKLSEHGKANALDIRSFKLSDGNNVKLTDPHVAHEFREGVRRSACARFSTVLGPGSDGYHEEHVHVDLQERRPGRGKLCHWDVRDGEPAPATTTRTTPAASPPRIETTSSTARRKKR